MKKEDIAKQVTKKAEEKRKIEMGNGRDDYSGSNRNNDRKEQDNNRRGG